MTQSIQLQHIGRVNAIPAGQLKKGMQMMWNFGETSTVKEITKETAKSVWVTEIADKSGREYNRRFSKTRLVAAF